MNFKYLSIIKINYLPGINGSNRKAKKNVSIKYTHLQKANFCINVRKINVKECFSGTTVYYNYKSEYNYIKITFKRELLEIIDAYSNFIFYLFYKIGLSNRKLISVSIIEDNRSNTTFCKF